MLKKFENDWASITIFLFWVICLPHVESDIHPSSSTGFKEQFYPMENNDYE